MFYLKIKAAFKNTSEGVSHTHKIQLNYCGRTDKEHLTNYYYPQHLQILVCQLL